MRCPKCGGQDDKVIDSRASKEGATIRRRRECLSCGHRFTTYEEIEREGLMVVKRDGRREEFSKDKLLSGLRKACQKRPVSPKSVEDLVEKIISELADSDDREIKGSDIGEKVMEGLKGIDQVAYVRFASVYRRFQEALDFVDVVQKLESKSPEGSGSTINKAEQPPPPVVPVASKTKSSDRRLSPELFADFVIESVKKEAKP